MGFYIVHARINPKCTFNLRKMLHFNGFTIYLQNRFDLKSYEILEDYSTIKEGPPIDSKAFVFDCIYNSPKGFPDQSVFRALETNTGVESYSAECRKEW